MASIAAQYGLPWEALWNHSHNADLKNLRKNPNILFAGDEVLVPERQVKHVPGATDTRHRFVRRGIPSKLRIRLLAHGRPRKHLPYIFDVEGKVSRGKTDDDGVVSLSAPPGAASGVLTLIDGDVHEQHLIKLGHLDPLDELSGLQQRLKNLGLPCDVTRKEDDQTELALRQFQGQEGLDVTGLADDATRARLFERHGS